MQKEKIYAFKGYEQYYFYNQDTLSCYWMDSLEWAGGIWIDRDIEYTTAAHIAHLTDAGMAALTENEFNDIVAKFENVDNETYQWLKNCELVNGQSVESVYGVSVEWVTIDRKTKASQFPKYCYLVDMGENDPWCILVSDIIKDKKFGKYLYVREN